MAVAFFDRRAGFKRFTEARVRNEAVLALATKIRYEINLANEYPKNFTVGLLATMKDGSTQEVNQPHMRGGARDPLSSQELRQKFADNLIYGDWTAAQAEQADKW